MTGPAGEGRQLLNRSKSVLYFILNLLGGILCFSVSVFGNPNLFFIDFFAALSIDSFHLFLFNKVS